jgi:tetratricopeptide (TPR) repeat protein
MKAWFCGLLLAAAAAAADAAAQFPPSSHRLADCENRWFLKEVADPSIRLLGFAYVDPDAGVTIEDNGKVAISADGALARMPDTRANKMRLIVRGVSNFEIACLSSEQASQLGLPLVPDWLQHYKDKREPGPHNVAWASFYNHIGAFEKALEFLRIAGDSGFRSLELARERGFALNALTRYQEAIEGLEIAVKSYPEDIRMLAELAYSHVKLREFRRATELYQAAIAKDAEGSSVLRWEYANNLAMAFAALGDDTSASEWSRKAATWNVSRASGNFHFCAVGFGFQVSPEGKLEAFVFRPPYPCGGGLPDIEVSNAWKMTACAFFSTRQWEPTYRAHEKPKMYYAFYLINPNRPAVIYPTRTAGASPSDGVVHVRESILGGGGAKDQVCNRMIEEELKRKP